MQMQRFAFLFIITTLLTMSGCRNTVDGVGKDVENAGENIQDSTK